MITYHWEYGKKASSGLRNVTGVVTTIQEPGVPLFVPVREIQLVTWSEAPNQGSFKFQTPGPATIIAYPGDTYGSYTWGPFAGGVTVDIPWDASSATIKAHLDSILGATFIGNDYFNGHNVQVGKTSTSMQIYFPTGETTHPPQYNFPLLQIVDNTLTAGHAGSTSPQYTTSTPDKTAPEGTIDLSDETEVTGLEIDTEYNVRLVVVNSVGTSYGSNQVVRTTTGGTVTLRTPEITGELLELANETTALITAEIDPHGADTSFNVEIRPQANGSEFTQISHIGFRCGCSAGDSNFRFATGGGTLDLNTFFIPNGWRIRFMNLVGGRANDLVGNTYILDNRTSSTFQLKTLGGNRLIPSAPGSFDAVCAVMLPGDSLIRLNTSLVINQPFQMEFTDGQELPVTLQGQLYVKEIVAQHPSVNLIRASRTVGGAAITSSSGIFSNSLDLGSGQIIEDRDGNPATSGYWNYTPKLRAFNAASPSSITPTLGFTYPDGVRKIHILTNSLVPSTDYEFKVGAQNSVGFSSGDWTTISTSAIPNNLSAARVIPVEFDLTDGAISRRYRENGNASGKPKYSVVNEIVTTGVHDSDIRWNGSAWVDDDGIYSPDDTPTFWLANDSSADHTGYLIDSISGVIYSSNVGATKEGSEPNHAGESGGHSVWFKLITPTSGTISISTDGSSFDTLLAAYTQPGSTMASLVEAASNDDIDDNNKASSIEFFSAAGTILYIAVDGKAGATGSIKLTWSAS